MQYELTENRRGEKAVQWNIPDARFPEDVAEFPTLDEIIKAGEKEFLGIAFTELVVFPAGLEPDNIWLMRKDDALRR